MGEGEDEQRPRRDNMDTHGHIMTHKDKKVTKQKYLFL
jgi:hypothetical protein